MQRMLGSAEDIVAAIRHVLAESLGEDEASLVLIPEPRLQPDDVQGCNWWIAWPDSDRQPDVRVRNAALEAQRGWTLQT